MGLYRIAFTAALLIPLSVSANPCLGVKVSEAATHANQLNTAMESLSRHAEALLNEAGANMDREAAHAATTLEHDRVRLIHERGRGVLDFLDRLEMLAGIRDRMVDKRDLALVDRFSALAANHVGRSSTSARDRVTADLSKLTRPGVAYDAGKLRDVLADIERRYGSCGAVKF